LEINDLHKEIIKVTGLSDESAKIVLYYAGATHGLPELEKFPILCVQGEPGTGKSTLLKIAASLSRLSKEFTGKGTSEAAARDELPLLGTAIIDEADGIKEDLLFNRHDRSISNMPYKQRSGETGFTQTYIDLFGATVLHKRDGADSGALASRSINIHTVFKEDVQPLDIAVFDGCREVIAELAEKANWSSVPSSTGSRSRDTWQPVLEFARAVGDEEFLGHVEREIAKSSTDLKFGMAFEPRQEIYSTILQLSHDNSDSLIEAVALKNITNQLKQEPEFAQYSSRKVGQIVRDLGFRVQKVRGEMLVFTGGQENLVSIGKKLGVADDWLEQG